jgi:enoyl-CoA hydratase/carnithine racemase
MVKSVRGKRMAVVETERHGQILVVRMNRPERLNALNHEMRTELAETWIEFRESDALEVAIFTGAGRGFCAGEDMKEALQDGAPGRRKPAKEDPFMSGTLEIPVISWSHGPRSRRSGRRISRVGMIRGTVIVCRRWRPRGSDANVREDWVD